MNTSIIFGSHDENTTSQFSDVASTSERSVLCADGHFGYVMPVGGVAAYRNQVSVVGVGFDIGCGNLAIKTDTTLSDLCGVSAEQFRYDPTRVLNHPLLNRLADDIVREISFGVGGVNRSKDAPRDDLLFESVRWLRIPKNLRDSLKDTARNQLGSVGSGNHYVDVFVDEEGFIWVGVHFGSRGLGHKIASAFLSLSQGNGWGGRGKEVEVLLDLNTEIGSDYWALMTLAGKYARAGRDWVTRKVVKMIGGSEVDYVHNHHNFAWEETHGEEKYVVVRKGATPAFPGQRGFVGGSMGDDAVILQGVGSTLSREALYSTVHGAGRVMSRTEAKGKWKKGQLVRQGKVTQKMMNEWVTSRGVILRGGGLDESPHAYRRLDEVLEDHHGTIEVLHTLRPIIVCMAP